jgi:predicted nucleotidyltransferase
MARRAPAQLPTPAAHFPNLAGADRRIVGHQAAIAASRSLLGVDAVALFGSLARSAPVRPNSDVDLLVLSKLRQSGRELRRHLTDVVGLEVELVIHTPSTLRNLARTDWSFIEHLRREHVALMDPKGLFPDVFRGAIPDRHDIKNEIRAHLDALAYLEDPEILSGQHITSYARLYGVAKSVVILEGLLAGEPEFDRAAAFEAWRRRHPNAAELAATAEELEPFFLRLRRRARVGVPWVPWRDTSRLRDAALSVRRLVLESAR